MSMESTLKKQIDRLKKELNNIKAKMNEAPPGDLIIYRSKNYIRWYEMKKDTAGKKKRVEIPKTNRSYAEQLAVKAYYKARMENINYKLALYNNIAALISNEDNQVEELLKDPEFASLIRPYYKSDREKFQEWAESEYQRSTKHPENQTVNSPHGRLRSKSEYIIFQELDKYGLSARYECQLIVGGVEIYPDFIVRHPVTGELFIWEHLGLIENQNYRDDFKKKLDLYASAGFYLGVNLIITTETSTHPIDIEYVDMMIEYYFKNIV